jgi:hypothetical protein
MPPLLSRSKDLRQSVDGIEYASRQAVKARSRAFAAALMHQPLLPWLFRPGPKPLCGSQYRGDAERMQAEGVPSRRRTSAARGFAFAGTVLVGIPLSRHRARDNP